MCQNNQKEEYKYETSKRSMLLNIVKIKDRDPRFNLTVVLENKSTSENVTVTLN